LALAALLPSQGGNAGKALVTSGSAASWGVVASGASIQVFIATGTYTPTAGKTTFLVFATGGGGGSSGINGAGGGGTAIRLYNTTELGSSASITIGAGGAIGSNGGSTVFTPAGSGLVITGGGGSNSITGGSVINSQLAITGGAGSNLSVGTAKPGGVSFWGGGIGIGGLGSTAGPTYYPGTAGVVLILEW
jgi:hypothetical protein